MIEQEIKKCYDLLKKNNVWNDDYDILRKNFKIFALKNHPDKGGIKEIFQAVSSCKDILDNDFTYFKNVINNKSYNYNEELIYDGDDSADEDYIPKSKPKKTKSKPKYKSKTYTHIDFETFIKKDCKGGRGGWLLNELRNFCNILGIENKGTKGELCDRLSKYFEDIEVKKTKDWVSEQYKEIDKEIYKDKNLQEELRKKRFEDEMKQREDLERVYREQERIRAKEEKELNDLSDKMSNMTLI
jgi:hypothetical protein